MILNRQFNIFKTIFQVKQCNVRNLNRCISCIRQSCYIYNICNDFHTDIFFNITWDLISVLYDRRIRMAAIENPITILIIFILLIANIDCNFRLNTVKTQRFCSNNNSSVINVKVCFRFGHGLYQSFCNICSHFRHSWVYIQRYIFRKIFHIHQQIIDRFFCRFVLFRSLIR